MERRIVFDTCVASKHILVWSVFSDDPNIQEKIDVYLDKFSNLPFWYQALFIGIVSSIYGPRELRYSKGKK